MKTLFPRRGELAVFLAMAIVGGLLCALSGQRDNMLFFCTLPVFLIAALMGFRRSIVVQPVEEAEEVEAGD